IGDHQGLSARSGACGVELLQELLAGAGVEGLGLAPVEKAAVPHPHRAPVANALPGRVVQEHRIARLGRNPHAAARTVLLEAYLVHRPQVNPWVLDQPGEFFYMPPGALGPPLPLPRGASAGGKQTAGRAAGIGAPLTIPRSAAPGRRIGSCHPTDSPLAQPYAETLAALHPTPRVAPRSAAPAVHSALLPPDQPIHPARSDATSTPPCEGRLPGAAPPPGSSCPV